MAGEKLFVNFDGQTILIVNPVAGEMKAAQFFVAMLELFGSCSLHYSTSCVSAVVVTQWLLPMDEAIGNRQICLANKKPLGYYSINHYTRIALAAGRI